MSVDKGKAKAVKSELDAPGTQVDATQAQPLTPELSALSRQANLEFKVIPKLAEDHDEEKSAQSRIRYNVYDIPDQLAAEKIIAQFQSQVEHKTVQCDGPFSIYARTQDRILLRGGSRNDSAAGPSNPTSLIEDSVPALFVILHPKSSGSTPTKPKFFREGDPDDSVTYYKIDEAGNINVNYQKIGGPPSGFREEGMVLHHDADRTAAFIFGQLPQFNYAKDDQFRLWAWEKRLVTRVIELHPGNFEDKIEISIKTVDLAQGPKYEAISYTWKETAYERAHASIWTKEFDATFRKMLKLGHAVYSRDDSGKESHLVVSAGLRDALRRLRDRSEKKTYWIDQLSIDQNNHSERAFQVSGMRYFYNRAQQVTVWTGDDDEDTKPAFDILRKISGATRVLGYIPAPEDLLEDANLDLPPYDSPLWKSVMSFFLRPVFG